MPSVLPSVFKYIFDVELFLGRMVISIPLSFFHLNILWLWVAYFFRFYTMKTVLLIFLHIDVLGLIVEHKTEIFIFLNLSKAFHSQVIILQNKSIKRNFIHEFASHLSLQGMLAGASI
jgi:hypothetical protein